jgi:translation initiation factor 2B subunit (eIF-2B alpha/beta/delta family)
MLNYKPTEQAVEKMIKLFTESAADKGVKLEREQAEYYVNELISTARPPKAIATKAEKTSGVYFNAPDFFVNKTTLADLETPPKTLPLESLTDDAKRVVEELLGKVEDPLQTILTGTNRLSLLTRRNQLFQTLNKSNQEILEKRAKFIEENPGKEIPAALRGMFRETELELKRPA